MEDHWIFIDRARTHELHATVEGQGPAEMFVVTEFPYGSRDPHDAVIDHHPVEHRTDVARALDGLAARLTLAGEYYRASASRHSWEPVRSRARPRVDLEGVRLPLPDAPGADAALTFHHFHQHDRLDRLLLTLPRVDLPDPRYVAAELAFRFPRADLGDLRIIHSRLTPATLDSQLALRHLALSDEGYTKLRTSVDYDRTFGRGWADDVKRVLELATERTLMGRTGRGVPIEREEKTLPVELQRLRIAFAHRAVTDVRQRHLPANVEADLMRQGEFVIRRWIQAKRRATHHSKQFALSILESYLLARYGWSAHHDALRDAEGAKLIRLTTDPWEPASLR